MYAQSICVDLAHMLYYRRLLGISFLLNFSSRFLYQFNSVQSSIHLMQPNSECNGYAGAPNAMSMHNQVTKKIQRIQCEGLLMG